MSWMAQLPDSSATNLLELLTPAEVATAWRVTSAEVHATLKKGDLKAKSIGSVWRVTKSAPTELLRLKN